MLSYVKRRKLWLIKSGDWRRKLTWFGHVSRMDERRLPSRAVCCYIKGRRKRGRPPKKWIDNIKDDVKLMELSIGKAVNLTRDRE